MIRNKIIPLSTVNILLLDDEPEVIISLEKAICSHGYRCITITDQNEAINIIEKRDPTINILIVDYLLKGATGLEVAQKVKEIDPTIYVILINDLPRNMSGLIALTNYDADSYYEKSDNHEDLLLKIAIGIKILIKNNFLQDNLTFEEKLRYLRKQNNMTREDVANYLGVAKVTISSYENGNIRPDFEKIRLLGRLYKVSYDYLLRD